MLEEFPVVVAEGTARLKSTGNLAGSILKLKRWIKNVVEWGLQPLRSSKLVSIRQNQSILMMFVVKFESCNADLIVLDQIWIWWRPISNGSNVTKL